MSRLEPPDALLVKLLRRSDAPSDSDIRRLRYAISFDVDDENETSTILPAAKPSSWSTKLGYTGNWGKGMLFVSALLGAALAVVGRLLVKALSFV